MRQKKTPDVTDDHTKKIRRRHNQTRCIHEGLTKGKMNSRIQYENAPSRGLPGILLHAKDFAPLTKLLPEPEKVHRRPYDGLRCPHEWPDVFTIRAECENFYHRVSILCQLRDSVTPALQSSICFSEFHCYFNDRAALMMLCKQTSCGVVFFS